MNNLKDTKVGDKVRIIDFWGREFRVTQIIEITPDNNIRVKSYKGLFLPDGREQMKNAFWTERVYLEKFEEVEE